MAITATKLRSDLYRVIDQVIKKGVPVEVVLRGRKVLHRPRPSRATSSPASSSDLV